MKRKGLAGGAFQPVQETDARDARRPLSPKSVPHTIRVAYHEAGHAVIARVAEIEIDSASIVPGKGFDGVVQIPSNASLASRVAAATASQETSVLREVLKEVQDRLIDHLAVALAGCIAEARLAGDPSISRRALGAAADWKDADGLAAAYLYGTDNDPEEIIERAVKYTQHMLKLFWPAVVALANELQVRKQLTGAEVSEIVDPRIQKICAAIPERGLPKS